MRVQMPVQLNFFDWLETSFFSVSAVRARGISRGALNLGSTFETVERPSCLRDLVSLEFSIHETAMFTVGVAVLIG